MELSMTLGCLLRASETQSQDHRLWVGHVLLQCGQLWNHTHGHGQGPRAGLGPFYLSPSGPTSRQGRMGRKEVPFELLGGNQDPLFLFWWSGREFL